MRIAQRKVKGRTVGMPSAATFESEKIVRRVRCQCLLTPPGKLLFSAFCEGFFVRPSFVINGKTKVRFKEALVASLPS